MKSLTSTTVCVFVLLSCLLTAQELPVEQLKQLQFRHIGPVGNRLVSVAGIPGDEMTYYVGAASGGIWKTVDGGLNWKPVFDKQEVHAIGALGISPADPEVVYAGTGEPFIRSNVSLGDGVYKSSDGGESWAHVGLPHSGRISRIVVHPQNADIVYASALGHAYTPQEERGIFRSMDGGQSWEHVLKVDEHTGASDLVMDPKNPRILFAGMWQLSMRPWTRTSGGPGSGIYKSSDGGSTWQKLEHNGLPEGEIGKIALAMTPAQPNRVYALIETGDGIPLNGEETTTGELWRSDNGGKSFALISSDRNLTGRGAYYTRCAASPDNPNEIYFLAAPYSSSIDGGKTAVPAGPGKAPNWDHHEMWIDPTDGNRQIVVGDGGLSISKNRGSSWHRVQLPIAQLYHVTTDRAVPYNVLTNRQDGPSMKGPSRSRMAGFFGGFIATGKWHDVGGGESGFATADPTDPDIVWSSASGRGALGGVVVRFNEKTGQFRQVEVWPEYTGGSPAADVKYRFQWTFPVLISPHDHNMVYVASQHVHRTTNGGQSWELASPDLTLNDKSKQQFSGGLTGDNIGVEYANVIYALDESPLTAGVLWAGTNDGLIHLSRNHGESWTDLTKNVPDMPEYGAVRNVEASAHDPATAYMTVDAHEMGDFAPYVYRTTNYGRSWQKITAGIDTSILSYCRMIKEDPVRPGLLYLGTENKLYFSMDDGNHWQSLMTNLPPTPMYWMDIPEHFNDLVLGTYGRGAYILDDISPLQQFDDAVMQSDAHLFAPKDAYRFRPISMTMQFFPEPSFGQDPPEGASINYWLSHHLDTTLQDSISLTILNMQGDTVRTMKHKGKAGINRVWWNFKSDPTRKIVYRTKPQHMPAYPLSPKRTRSSHIPATSLIVPPGQYQVVMQAGDQMQTQRLSVLKDPNSEGTEADIAAQYALLSSIRDDIDALSTTVNEMEVVRRQLQDLSAILPGHKAGLRKDLHMADSAIVDLESELVQLMQTGTGQDMIRTPAKLYGKLSYLVDAVGVADFKPADQHQEVFEMHHANLMNVLGRWQAHKEEDLASLLEKLTDQNIGPIIIDR
ncbi:MAG: glycosyl hydrolase [Saprospiraceae bacterium]|nr:glycosyl hydrolase [Saprospiraceae bacterium]